VGADEHHTSPADADLPNRCRDPRHVVLAPVEIEWGSRTLSAQVTDISLSGMFLAMNNPLWVNAMFTAVVHFPEPLRVDCVVRRVVPGVGMGVQFLRLSPEVQARLMAILPSLPRK